jgi:endonuclease-3
MGCERLADLTAPPLVQKFQTLVALMLSVQTKDEITSMVVKRLQAQELTPEKIAKMTPEELSPLIRESNFHKRKSSQLIELARKVLV